MAVLFLWAFQQRFYLFFTSFKIAESIDFTGGLTKNRTWNKSLGNFDYIHLTMRPFYYIKKRNFYSIH